MKNTYPMRASITGGEDGGPARIDVYDDIGAGGWFSEGLTAKAFAAQLAKLSGPLDVHINSAGGAVDDGIAIGSNIRNYKGFKRTVVDGMAASIASVIFQAGDERVVEPGSMVFVHDAHGMCVGNAADMAKFSADLDKNSDNIAQIYADRAGGTAEQWRDVMREETWYNADEAVAAGLADRKGDSGAQLPAGADVAAFAIPGRIAASLRMLPATWTPGGRPQAQAPVIVDADGNHGPMSGTHAHSHPAYGSQGGDSTHAHDHSHDGEASHKHSHAAGDRAPARPANGPGKPYKPAPYRRDPDETVQCPLCGKFNDIDAAYCDQCGAKLTGRTDVEETTGPGTSGAPASGDDAGGGQPGKGGKGKKGGKNARRKDRLAAAADMHGDHARVDPDGDGDCDACPGGDTDHDYWSADGEQIQPLPGEAEDSALADLRALIRQEITAILAADGDVDNSDWDASRAWHNGAESDDPAAFYAGICAGKKDGDKATQAAWALPYKYTPSSAPNAAGVRDALGRLDQTQGLTNHDEAKALLQRLMKRINPDYEPSGDHAGHDLAGISLDEIRAALKGAH